MFYSVIYNDGFAVLDTLNKAYAVVEGTRQIAIKMVESYELGYVYGCNQYAKRYLDAGYKTLSPFPTHDVLLSGGGVYFDPTPRQRLAYIADRVHSNGMPKRFFSLVTPFGFGYFDEVNHIFSVIQRLGGVYLEVQEHQSIDLARKKAYYDYLWHQQRMVAYLTDGIQIPENLVVNEFFCADRQPQMISLPF